MRAPWLRLLLAYVVLSLVITAPGWAGSGLLGDAEADVWNHAWGLWWVRQALAGGHLPWHTALAGAPRGGVLFFIDPLGALWGLLPGALFGPRVAWNLLIVGRVAFAGLTAHGLSRELSGRGPHNLVAGVAFASTPYLLCEISNGIGEVVAVGWVAATLWVAARAARTGRTADHLVLGLVAGLTAWASFYYALLVAILVGLGAVVLALRGRLQWRGAVVAGLVAVVIGLPSMLLLRASFSSPDALMSRDLTQNAWLLAHNAIDPREWFAPGAFHSVDLRARYGEAFVHSLYLRWTVLLAALVGLRRGRRAWALLGLAAVSLTLGLGGWLWWGGQAVRVGGHMVPLPFAWLQWAVPQLSVTHPARLGVGALLLTGVLAAMGARGRGWMIALLVPAMLVETAWLSAAPWPLPTAPAQVPALYAALGEGPGAVLDLPAESGRTMSTSRYFWYQVVHRRPVPWFPDVSAARNGDPDIVRLFEPPPGGGGPRPLQAQDVDRLRQRYAWVVVHTDLVRGQEPDALVRAVTAGLGSPDVVEGALRAWRL